MCTETFLKSEFNISDAKVVFFLDKKIENFFIIEIF
jgi:hypothetical protein